MKVLKYLIITVALLTQSITIQAQNTEGKEFWLTFGNNSSYQNNSNLYLQIRIVNGSEPTTGSIYFTYLEKNIDFELDPFQIYNYTLNNTERQTVYNYVMGKSDYSIHITSFEPVSVYAFNHYPQITDDVTNVLPVSALGNEYYQMSYTVNSSVLGIYRPDAYAVVATQNNTHLYHNESYVETLDKGQVYYRTSDTDMTGAFITSNHPVTFFAVHQSTHIPGNSGCSHLMQQLAPVNTWGRVFFVPATLFEKDIVRIVASRSNTDITLTGGTLRTGVSGAQNSLTGLQAGQFVELDMGLTGCFIETNQPVGVCSYIAGNLFTGFKTTPSQCWIPGVKQLVARTVIAPFVPSSNNNFAEHYALVTTPTATRESTKVSINGEPFSELGGTWAENTHSGMSFYNMLLPNPNVSYIFTNPKGVIILGYAAGQSPAGQPASYYYLAGSAMRDLDAAFYANDIHFQDLKDNTICEGLVNFRAEIEGYGIEVDSIKWYIDGVEEDTKRDSLEWSKPFLQGEYEIRMWCRFENDSTISKTGMLVIEPCIYKAAFFANEVHNDVLPDTTFCNKTVLFRAETGALSTEPGHIRWYIDYNDGNGYVEEPAGFDQTQWSKDFANDTYPVKMWVLFENGEDATITSTLNIQALWIKIRNVRY